METLVRTRGIFEAVLKTATSAGDGYFGAIGIGRVSTPAFVAGIVSMPTPLTDLAWDGWLYHSFFSLHAGVAGDSAASSTQRIEIDSKAMRKLGTDETFYAAMEVIEVGTATMSLFLNTRMLSKLP